LRSSLPDFPWDALAPYGDKARAHPGGIIDLSVGTPVDPTPEFIQTALRDASNSPSYPVTAGTPQLRGAITAWAKSRLGATGDFDVLPVIGSKELVAWLPTILESKKVLIPEIAYPTYHVGALIAQAQSIPVPISAKSWPSADLAWLNSPSNPTGRVHSVEEIKECIEWSRTNNAVLISDECYLEFEHNATPTSVMALTVTTRIFWRFIHYPSAPLWLDIEPHLWWVILR
jgi:aspartate/methionine/tyrosine aminotransferase